MAIKKIELCWIATTNLPKARSFFTETLGLTLKESDETYGWLEVEGKEGGTRLGIGKEGQESLINAGQNAVVTFTVDNLDSMIDSLTQKGVTFVGKVLDVPGVPRMIFFKDFDNNTFQLVEEPMSK